MFRSIVCAALGFCVFSFGDFFPAQQAQAGIFGNRFKAPSTHQRYSASSARQAQLQRQMHARSQQTLNPSRYSSQQSWQNRGMRSTSNQHRYTPPSYHRPTTPSFHRPSTPSFQRPTTPSFHRPSTPSFYRPSTPTYRPPTPSFHHSF